MGTLIDILFLALVLYIIFSKRPTTTKSHWQQFFDGTQFSTKAFYDNVVESLNKRQIRSIDYEHAFSFQTSIMSDQREYLVLTREDLVFYVCAAQFGTGSFVSWWLAEKDRSIIARIPLINTLAGKNRARRTYYQLDTEAAYRSIVHTCVMEAIDAMTESKGMRGLAELERLPKLRSLV